MMRLPLIAGAVVAVALAAFPASAAVIISAFLGGPFSSANPIGTLPATFAQAGNTYDFTFDLVAPVTGISATQVAAIVNGTTRANEQVQYQIYQGVPTTADPENGTLIATSLDTFSPTVFVTLSPGEYFVNLLTSEISVSGEVVSGSFVTAPLSTGIPEPAGWALMLLGAGLVGRDLRRRRKEICTTA